MNKKVLLIAASLLLTACGPIVLFPTTNEPTNPTLSDPTNDPTINPGTTSSDPTTVDPTTDDPTSEIPPTTSSDPTTTPPTTTEEPITTIIPPSSEEWIRELTAIDIIGDMTDKVYEIGDRWDLTGLDVIGYYDDGSEEIIDSLKNLTHNIGFDIKLDHKMPEIGLTTLKIDLNYKEYDLSITRYITNLTVTEVLPPEPMEGYLAPEEYELSATFPNNYLELSYLSPYDFRMAPSTGDVNVLVLPVAFTDSKVDNDETLEAIQIALNGTDEETGWKSADTFFKESSFGSLNPNYEVAPEWFQYHKSSYEVGTASANTTVSLLNEAVQWYKDTYSNDECQRFDKDKNGYIDAVILVYAEHNHIFLGSEYSNFWAYAFSAQGYNPDIKSPNANAFLWASYDFILPEYKGSRLIDYDAHTLIHEFGHVLGLNDYYDYNGKTSPAGGFDMQDSNVGDHNSFSKFSFGWTKPYVVSGNGEITLSSSSLNQNQFVIIPPGGFNAWNKSPFDEYLLLEFYTPEGCWEFDAKNETYPGYPSGLTESGVKVYHIDARLVETSISNGRLNYKGYAKTINDSLYYDVAASNSSGGDHQTDFSEAKAFDQVHLFSATKRDRFSRVAYIRNDDLFQVGDSFSMEDFASFFPNDGVFNNGRALDVSFKITNLTSDSVTIKFTKN